MSKVLAIAVIAIRNAVRSRVVLVLMACLLLAIVGLPLTVEGDGTLSGQVQIVLNYTLGAVTVILSLVTLWAGCAAISTDIQERRIQLVVAKPVHRFQVWLGKWAGLVILNALLLAASAGVTYALLRWTTRPQVLSAGEQAELRENILTARRRLRPRPVDVTAEARAEFEEARAQGRLPEDVPPEQALEAIRRSLLTHAFSVPPAGKRAWVFDLAGMPPANRDLLFRFRFSSSRPGDEKIPGLWRVGRENDPAPFEYREESVPGGLHTFAVPASAVAGEGPLVVEYANLSSAPVTVVFPPGEGLDVLAYAAGFENNFLRALLMIFCHLVFLAALGVAMGSLFSLPVASFAAFCVLLLILTGGYIESIATSDIIFESHHAVAREPRLWDHFFRGLFKVMNAAVSPLRGEDPLALLATGQLITGARLARAALVQALLYTALLAALSGWILNRREIALPAG